MPVVSVNLPELRKKLLESKAFENGKYEAAKQIRPTFNAARALAISDFNNHPVTKEIDAGPGTANISQTLNGYDGDLFSFIGFTVGDNPTKIVKNMLLKIEMKYVGYSRGKWNFNIYALSMQDIADATPLPWEDGKSWVEGIHSGISGFGRYMASSRFEDFEDSRSKRGLQVGNKIREGQFQRKKYVAEILRNFWKLVK